MKHNFSIMHWTIKIGNKPKERMLIEYDPIAGFLFARGQYKIHDIWTVISSNKVEIDSMNFEKIQKLLSDAIIELEKQIEIYEDLNKTFGAIGEIVTVDVNDTSESIDMIQ